MLNVLRSSRWLLGVLLIALASGGCGGGAASNPQGGHTSTATPTTAANPTPAHIAGWQTYNDKQYQFTIQYPPGWTGQLAPPPQDAPSDEIINFYPTSSASGSTVPTQNIINITVATGGASSVGDTAPPGFAPSGNVTVDGTSQTLLSGPAAGGGQGLLVLFANGSQLYLFASSADAAHAAMFQQLFTQMLSTFQVDLSY